MGDDIADNLALYREAVSCMQVVVEESQKTENVDLALMLVQSQRCTSLLDQLSQVEDDFSYKEGLIQLLHTIHHHEKIFSAKIHQLHAGNSEGTRATEISRGSKRCIFTPSPSSKHIRSTSPTNTKKQPLNHHHVAAVEEDDQQRNRRLAIQHTIVPKGKLSFADVAGLTEAKQSLREAIIMPLQYNHLFTGGRKPWRRILLFGPPGTGKSRLAKAVSTEIQSTFYCVSSSDLISSWVGESEKLIKELFSHACRQEGRSVIFIDEIDSLCRRRSSREEEHTRRIKTELLHQMEGAETAAERIFLLCATNCPWELDPAFLRRFQKRIYIPLPNQSARMALMQLHTKDDDLSLTSDEWTVVAAKTEGYSGSDLATLVLEALFQPIRDLQRATHWKDYKDGHLTPCSPDEPDAIKAKMSDLPAEQVKPRQVCVDDFLKSLTNHRNTVSSEDLEHFKNFTENFGQNG